MDIHAGNDPKIDQHLLKTKIAELLHDWVNATSY